MKLTKRLTAIQPVEKGLRPFPTKGERAEASPERSADLSEKTSCCRPARAPLGHTWATKGIFSDVHAAGKNARFEVFDNLKRLTAILFPPRCMFCRRIVNEGDICQTCRDRLPRCGRVKGRGEFFSRCAAALYYVDDVRRALLLFKFRGRQAFAVGLGALMAETVREELAGTYDLITWAPVSDRRKRRRGYDQSELLCRETAKQLGEPYVRTLKKVRHTAPNSSIDTPEGRAANVLGAYEAADPEAVRGRRVLLVDDIYTTGATLSECARMLLMAGAEDVVCCTAAARPSAKKRKN